MNKILRLCLVVALSLGFFGCTQSSTSETVAIVEKFGAIWCLGDVYYNETLPKLSEELSSSRIIFLHYYVDSTDDHPFPRLSCQESSDRMKWYMKDRGIPTIYFNGTDYVKGNPNTDAGTSDGRREACYDLLKNKILSINPKPPAVSLNLSCTKKEIGELEIKASCKVLEDISYKDLHLLLCLTESKIPYVAINGDKIHYFVFREWIQPTEFKGNVGIPMTLTKINDQFETIISYKLNTELFKNELNLVVFVQDFETKSILQGLQLPLKE
jgi:hypothetical protein